MAPPEVGDDAHADYFNQLHRPLPDQSSADPAASKNGGNEGRPLNETQPKAKRIACVLCRKRKLKCDGARPSCSTCKRLSHDCAYDEVRKKSGPKRGYVKLLEARLQQVETLLKTQEQPESRHAVTTPPSAAASSSAHHAATAPVPAPVSMGLGTEPPVTMADFTMPPAVSRGSAFSNDFVTDTIAFQDSGVGNDFASESFPWEMVGLGLEEPLPAQDTIDELHRIYFEKVHPSCPIIHRARYLATCNLSHQMRPPVALRYAMWTMAASVSDKYEGLAEHFYLRTRKYLQADEMRNHGEGIVSLQHCQAWVIICIYEFKNMYFPRAWQTTGRAVRMAQMLGLHRIDGFGLDVKQCLPPPKDWVEREERRRTFWLAFCEDRYASVGTGWPMTIDERDIMTNLPASEEAFLSGNPEQTYSLEQALKPNGASKLSSIGGVIVLSCMFGRNLLHLHRPSPDDNDDDLNGEFWRRHRRIEGILSHTALALPERLRLPAGLADPNAVFMNMSIHTSAICLHQAAIFKADRHKLPPNVGSESRVRCVAAAAEIARIMRMLSHLDLSNMNPFLAFCLYVAARVFIQYLKFRPKDEQMTSSLQFLLAAMHALKRKNPLTESFLVQLDVDLEGMNIDVGMRVDQAAKDRLVRLEEKRNIITLSISFLILTCDKCEVAINDNLDCTPLLQIRDSQAQNSTLNQNFRQQSRPNAYSTSLPIDSNATNTINVDFNMMNNADSPSYSLPNRQRGGFSGPASVGRVASISDSLSPSGSDNAPSPANERGSSRSTSSKDASSHTSFTPPSTTGLNETIGSLPNNISTSTSPNTTSTGQTPGPYGTSTFFNNSMDSNTYTSFQSDFFVQSIGGATSPGFGINNFDMSGVDMNISTGMTPMATDTDWSRMMEDMERFAGNPTNAHNG
ncbi:hypothetical protein, variant 1 [Verruconis gallopava]|uniref:Zn(2)-C6 fungal-type domain-containing protein n=1 Tax=Verruconis gallopava TaxID=253628 RepID=A0A0D2AK68_9PEZI|nr:hypothetical protein, variant 1 [Verruconis gallopava]KIW06955.1 hypothetical protein, variant 1 [Verruconis gallopava]